MDIKETIKKTLQTARKSMKLTQEDIAKQWGMKREQYARYERGGIELNYNQIIWICQTLELSPNELFNYDEITRTFETL